MLALSRSMKMDESGAPCPRVLCAGCRSWIGRWSVTGLVRDGVVRAGAPALATCR